MATVYAHSLPITDGLGWERLSDHLHKVGTLASWFADAFGWGPAARIAGQLHDIGKCSGAFQDYIRRPPGTGRGPDHSTAGAIVAAERFPGPVGTLLAAIIAGHHGGLPDGDQLARRLAANPEAFLGWQDHAGALPDLSALKPASDGVRNAAAGMTVAFLTRMLFSCLVDADSLMTEAFVSGGLGAPVTRGGFSEISELRDRLRVRMAEFAASTGPVNRLRADVLAHAVSRAAEPPGLFTLTVPTGGGKTLASLSFALEHAVRHGLRRVIYVIPFTSIIEQTAEVFRAALRTEADILEHHASFDWERAGATAETDDEGRDGTAMLRLASENWDVPIVVTTAVQFFESLFSSRRARCRKLHNLARAVVVLDEAQTMPVHLLRPTLAAVRELAANYRASVVICTATQPAWRESDGALPPGMGLPLGPERELAPDPPKLYAALKRVTVEMLAEPVADATIVARFAGAPQMLCIVNGRAHARDIFDAIAPLPGAIHLTTLMCAKHRRAVLARAREDLRARRPVRLVATSLIEAGVDISFPEVWRAVAGLDAIAQAAGRCNREGDGLALGRVVVFEPADAKPPHALRVFWQAARPALAAFPDDALSLPAIHRYFRELYCNAGADALDAATLDGGTWPILRQLADRAPGPFPFASIARAYRLIDEAMDPVVVPYDAAAVAVLDRMAAMDRPLAADFRHLQQYVVGIPARPRADWLAAGVLRPVHPALGDALLRFEDDTHYRPATGIDLRNPAYRDLESNVI